MGLHYIVAASMPEDECSKTGDDVFQRTGKTKSVICSWSSDKFRLTVCCVVLDVRLYNGLFVHLKGVVK